MLTPEQVADRWGVNIKTVYVAIKKKQIPYVQLGRVYRIPVAVVESGQQGGGMSAKE